MKFQNNWFYFLTLAILTVSVSAPKLGLTKETQQSQPTTLQKMGTEELVRTRCSKDNVNVYLEWSGSVYAFVPQEKQQKLFNIIGMNVARCLKDKEGKWFLTSRELNLYLDPQTNQLLNQWKNPWTGETVPVVHVANSPIQLPFRGEPPVIVNGENVTFLLDVVLTYPNILAGDIKFKDYSPEALYQTGEFFQLTVSKNQLTDSTITTVPLLTASWTRVGPWLPWMKMKGKPGQLVYTSNVRKTLNFEELSPLLKQTITLRLPFYREAPRCFLPSKNETSWSYFRKYFNEYLQKKQFPVPERKSDLPCQK